jgi:hypothetical protein
MGVEELVKVAFELAELTAGCPVLVDKPGQPVGAGLDGHGGGVDGCELANVVCAMRSAG